MIISCGEALIDFVPQNNAALSYAPCPGGSPFNLAIASARLGAPTGFLGKISTDFFGDLLYSRLQSEGVSTDFTSRSDCPSTLAFVKTEKGTEPRYAFYTENTADRNLQPEDIPAPLPQFVECLEFGSISLLLSPQAQTIKSLIRREALRRVISFDPNVRPVMVKDPASFRTETEEMVKLSAIVKVSCADLEWLYPDRKAEESAGSWLTLGAKAVVMTRGKDGAVLLTPAFRCEAPEYEVRVKDTIGAGDTFHAAFLVRLRQLGALKPERIASLSPKDGQDALKFAVKASSLNCARQGADPPSAAEMDACI